MVWQVTPAVGIVKTFSASTLGCRPESSLRLGGDSETLGFNRETNWHHAVLVTEIYERNFERTLSIRPYLKPSP